VEWEWRTLPSTFSRMCKLQLCRQDSVHYLHCNAFQWHFYYRSFPSSYLRSLYCFLWFEISKNSSVQFQSCTSCRYFFRALPGNVANNSFKAPLWKFLQLE
jgi:hypothetical protein